MLTIKANKQLFESWKSLARRIKLLSSVAQNDMEVENEHYKDWLGLCSSLRVEFEDMIARTQLWVEYGKEVKE